MSGPPLIPLSLTKDGITYTNQATFFSPNQPYFIRNGEVQTNPIFTDSITIQSAVNNEETVIQARDYQLGPDAQTGILGGTIIRNIDYNPAPGVASSITSAITASFNSATQEGSVALYARNIDNNALQNPQLEVTKDRGGNEAVNAYCPIDIEQGIVTPYRIRTDAGGGTDRLQMGVKSVMLATNRGDIEIYNNENVFIERNTIVNPLELYIQSNDNNFRNTIKQSSITATYQGSKITALESVFNGLTRQGTLFGAQRLDVETELTNAPANRNRAVRYDGLALNPDSSYGEEIHYWNNTFTDIIRATGNPTGITVPFEAQIQTATLFNCNVSNIATIPVVNGNVRFNSTVTMATSTIMNVANVSTINVSTITAFSTVTTNLNTTNAQITNLNGSPTGTGGLIPTGSLLPWAPAVYSTTTPPAGYLFCDGALYNNIDYPVLAALLGVTYGGNPGATFAVPDMRFGKSIIGGCVNNATFQVLNPGGAGRTIVSYTDISITVQGVEYGTTFRNFYIKPATSTGEVYTGPGLRVGYSMSVIGGSGQVYNITDTLTAPFGNNARGPQFNLFLTDIPINATDRPLLGSNGITVFPYPTFDPSLDAKTLPDVRAGSNNLYLNYTQKASEVGAIQYNVFRGGVQAAAGSAWTSGDPNLVYSTQYLNGLGNFTDFNNNNVRSPVGSSIPNAYSYSMGYIIKF